MPVADLETTRERYRKRKENVWQWEPEEFGYILKAKLKKNGRDGESRDDGSFTNVFEIGGSMTEVNVRLGWRVTDIPLAAKVLREEEPSPVYSNEAEMRRVFGLVYDVLRYKKIFVRALADVGFWIHNGALKNQEKVVWLLLYDMQGRKFSRPRADVAEIQEREKIYIAAGLMEIENVLNTVKTHLAASISRLRISGSALNLDELLPTRLRVIEGVPWGEDVGIATGWINTAKISSKEEFKEEMSKLDFICHENQDENEELGETEYAFDPICPKMIELHERAREVLATSDLVRDHRFVLLERSLCLGVAALARVIRDNHLHGSVILTHSVAPRHTGYLAGLLDDIDYAGKLFVFGVGDRLNEYENYLKDLGISLQQCCVFSEKYVSHPEISELDRATIVFATPSCSYTGIKDIVDLAVARGGDLHLLEALTNSYAEDTDDNAQNNGQWQRFLADQMSTLQYALTRPNVQLLLYEVHAMSPLETTEMIRAVVDHVNRMAMEKYVREHPVPNSDLFEIGSIEDVYGENMRNMLDPGCFLGVIKRKEMMQFDPLFMIKVAESKGLFGHTSVYQQAKSETTLDRSPRRSSQSSARKCAKRVNKIEIERLMAHTYSSLSKSTQENRICPRHKRCSSWSEAAINQDIEGYKLDPKSSNMEVESPKAWKRQKESVNRLCANIGGKFSRKKELRAISSMFSPRMSYDTSSFQTIMKREENSILLANLFTVEPVPRYECEPSSSTILRSPILARAARRVPLESSEVEDRDEIKIQSRARMGHRCWTSRKMSRLLHPAGSPSNVLDTLLDVA